MRDIAPMRFRLGLCLAALAGSACSTSRAIRRDFYAVPPAAADRSLRIGLVIPRQPARPKVYVRDESVTVDVALEPFFLQAVKASLSSVGTVQEVPDARAGEADVTVSLSTGFPAQLGFILRRGDSGQVLAQVAPVDLSVPDLDVPRNASFPEQARRYRLLWKTMGWNPYWWFISPHVLDSAVGWAAQKSVERRIASALTALPEEVKASASRR